MARLAGKIALITGGTSGIGRGCARRFRDEGATVIITGADDADIASARDELGVETLVSDAADLDAIAALVAHIQQRHGRLDILMPNAGIGGRRMFAETDPAYFDAVLNLNLRGVYFLVQAALPLLHAGASVILIASASAHKGAIGNTAYGASKAAIRSIGRSIGAELAPRGIRVNTLTPGAIDTPLMDKGDTPRAKVIEIMKAMVPMGRIGTVEEVAHAALFLASDEASYITASEIIVGGGMVDV